MLDRIMLALDGSSLAEQALPFAVSVARAFGSEIIILRVVEKDGAPTGRSLDSFDWRLGRAEAIEYLSGIKEQLEAEAISVDIDVTGGRAADEILEMARVRGVDLVVIGSHGIGGLTHLQMASTAQQVVSGSETSVLVVPATDTARSGSAFTSVLVPVDGSHHGEWTASVAARLARSQEAELVVLHIAAEPFLFQPQGREDEEQLVSGLLERNIRVAGRYLNDLTGRLNGPGLTIRSRVTVATDVAHALELEAGREQRPLLVLSARGLSRCEHGPYGSLVTVMLSGTSQPVLVLREPDQKDRSPRRWRCLSASSEHRRAVAPRAG